MVKVYRSTVIESPIGMVWQVLRDFNAHDQWHPAIATSHIDPQKSADQVGVMRNFSLKTTEKLREKLIHLSDKDHMYTYTIVDSDIPLFHYVATIKLYPISDKNHTFWVWQSTFNTPTGQEKDLATTVATLVYEAGFNAIRNRLL